MVPGCRGPRSLRSIESLTGAARAHGLPLFSRATRGPMSVYLNSASPSGSRHVRAGACKAAARSGRSEWSRFSGHPADRAQRSEAVPGRERRTVRTCGLSMGGQPHLPTGCQSKLSGYRDLVTQRADAEPLDTPPEPSSSGTSGIQVAPFCPHVWDGPNPRIRHENRRSLARQRPTCQEESRQAVTRVGPVSQGDRPRSEVMAIHEARAWMRPRRPASNVGPCPARTGCTRNSYSSISPRSANARGSVTPPTNRPSPGSCLSR